MAKNDKNGDLERRIAYSTDPAGFNPFKGLLNVEGEDIEEGIDKKSAVRIHLEKKGRGGKTVSILKGIKGPDEKLVELQREIKNHCGAGGSIKDDEILIQGDHRNKIIAFLKSCGFSDVKNSGG